MFSQSPGMPLSSLAPSPLESIGMNVAKPVSSSVDVEADPTEVVVAPPLDSVPADVSAVVAEPESSGHAAPVGHVEPTDVASLPPESPPQPDGARADTTRRANQVRMRAIVAGRTQRWIGVGRPRLRAPRSNARRGGATA